MRMGSFFSGCGVMDYGLARAGMDIIWTCEKDDFRRSILEMRWPDATHYDDITTFDASQVEKVDIVAGAFPPQGVSQRMRWMSDRVATGAESQGFILWHHMARHLGALMPRWVFLESLANILRYPEAFGIILRDLAEIGYDVEWDCIPAAALGAPHKRDRLYLTAHLDSHGLGLQSSDQEGQTIEILPLHSHTEGADQAFKGRGVDLDWGRAGPGIRRWSDIIGRACPEPLIQRMDDGPARRVERLRVEAVNDGVLTQISEWYGKRILAYEGQ